MVHRNAREPGVIEDPDRLFKADSIFHKDDINPWCHDLPRGGIGKIKNRVEHVLLPLLDCALLLTHIDPFLDLLLRYNRFSNILSDTKGRADLFDKPDKRSKETGEKEDNGCDCESKGVRCSGCIDLGPDLAKDEQHEHDKSCRNPDTEIPKHPDCNRSCN